MPQHIMTGHSLPWDIFNVDQSKFSLLQEWNFQAHLLFPPQDCVLSLKNIYTVDTSSKLGSALLVVLWNPKLPAHLDQLEVT